jgi:hypothetical protein
MLSKLYSQLNEDVSSFTYAMAGRTVDDEEAVNTDRHVVIESEDNMHGIDDVYKGLHTAITNSDQLVVFGAKKQMQSAGSIAAIRSIIDESGIDYWGVKRRGDTTIEFENGSTVKSVTLTNNGNSIRGYSPDYFSINESYVDPDEEIITDVIAPMIEVHDTNVWLNTGDVGKSTFAELLFNDGAYVRTKQ